MLKNFLLKMKLKKSSISTKKQLEKGLCNYKSPFSTQDLHTLFRILKNEGASTIIKQVDGKTIEVNIESSPIDWFSFRIKYSVPMMDIIMRIQVFAGAPQVGSFESDTINLRVESIMDDAKPRRKIIERNMSFINAISFENLESNCKTPSMETNLITIKKILADSFKIIICHIIDWRKIS